MASTIDRQATVVLPSKADTSKLRIPIRARYDNWIGGEYVAPKRGQYFVNPSPITGKPLCEVARSTHEDVDQCAQCRARGRSEMEPDVGGRLEPTFWTQDRGSHWRKYCENMAMIETVDNGKPIRETTHRRHSFGRRSLPLFRREPSGRRKGRSARWTRIPSPPLHEPLGVVGQIIPWNFPLLMAVWKLAPALAAGNCVVIKPAEQTPVSIMAFMELIADILPEWRRKRRARLRVEAGKPLASSPRIGKIAFTGETTTGRLIMQYASENLIPVTLELGGKSPNIFFADVMEADDDFFDKALEGFVMFAFNQGEVCTCPSRPWSSSPSTTGSWSARSREPERSTRRPARHDDHARRPSLQ